MANTKSARKRIRVIERKRIRNRYHRVTARTQVKRARVALSGEDLEEARAAVRRAASTLDHVASKGVIHKNNAARRKSRLMKALAKLEAQATSSK